MYTHVHTYKCMLFINRNAYLFIYISICLFIICDIFFESKTYFNSLLYSECMQCNTSYHGECPKHGVALHISSKDVDNKATDTTRARASLPDCLCLKESSIPGAGTGVFANIEIPGSVLFGPYAGDILLDDVIDSGYQWEVGLIPFLLHFYLMHGTTIFTIYKF